MSGKRKGVRFQVDDVEEDPPSKRKAAAVDSEDEEEDSKTRQIARAKQARRQLDDDEDGDTRISKQTSLESDGIDVGTGGLKHGLK